MPNTTPSEALTEIDKRLADLKHRRNSLTNDRHQPAAALDRARVQALNLQAEKDAGHDVRAELKKAIVARDEARTAYEQSEARDWAGERQTLDKAIRIVDNERAHLVASQAVPLVDELVPRATAVNEQIVETMEALQLLLTEHSQIRGRAEAIITTSTGTTRRETSRAALTTSSRCCGRSTGWAARASAGPCLICASRPTSWPYSARRTRPRGSHRPSRQQHEHSPSKRWRGFWSPYPARRQCSWSCRSRSPRAAGTFGIACRWPANAHPPG